MHDGYVDFLFYSKEQDERTRRSYRQYTDEEIEQLANQPKLEPIQYEHRPIVSK